LMGAEDEKRMGGFRERVIQYFRELSIELKKITFPEHNPVPFRRGWAKAELWRATITVFIFTGLFAIILSILDIIMTKIFGFIFG